MQIPEHGVARRQVLSDMQALRIDDADWQSGHTWSLVYQASEEHTEFLKEAYGTLFSENGLNPIAFPSLRQFEAEVVRMTATMLNGDAAVAGTMTSGGTESLLMTVKTYRDWGRATKGIEHPNMILPRTAHAAFGKAAHYFGVEPIWVDIAPDLRADVAAMQAAVTGDTVLLVGSAPNYPHGMIDPIEELATVAMEREVGMHVDACLGGFLLPWVERLGYPIPPFDFRVTGVTSMSADVHKYGYAAKGASTVMYRNAELRRHQFHVTTGWPGGIYASPSMAGTRPGGAIAAAWAALNAMGQDGYLAIAEEIMSAAHRLIDGVSAIDGVRVLGTPPASVFAFESDSTDVDIYAVGDALEARGWHMDRQIAPASLHVMVTSPAHGDVAEDFLADLSASVEQVRRNPAASQQGQAALYGMMTTLPDPTMVDEMVLQMLDGLYST
ncbi:MAG: aminotransferase class V-fold PLP-dependent enzyme [Acidimicrobiia bacterium]|nr:aminotransferase class V-fold PLP-dependent enzyme [Acidimicrobiia bacterium]